MDFKQKRKELLALWEDSFALCRAFIDAVKAGEAKMNASLLKEINAFLKLSGEVLNQAEEQEAQDRAKAITLKGEDAQGLVDAFESLTEEDLDVPPTFTG
jgi:hypothetical protein